jgi:hypothetical protein
MDFLLQNGNEDVQTEEYLKEMEAKGESVANSFETKEETNTEVKEKIKPEGVPDKFWDKEKGEVDYDSLVKSYKELESKFSKPEEKEPEVKLETVEDAKTFVQSKGLDFNKYATEFDSNGNLSEDSIKELEEKGIPLDMVNSFTNGLKAQQEIALQEVYKVVGGKDKMTDMLKWAETNLSPEDINAFNNSTKYGNKNQALLAVRGLLSIYNDTNGVEPKLVKATSTSINNQNYKPFESNAQLIRAMQDKKYATDEAYRKEVAERIKVSNI